MSVKNVLEDGTEEWRLPNGQLHREKDQPAIIYPNGCREWWINGKRHRSLDKPAILYPLCTKQWYLNGQLHRENDKPAVIWERGAQEWWLNGKRHRSLDQPAVIWPKGTQEWYLDGQKHRKGGPGVIYGDKDKDPKRYNHGEEYTEDEYWIKEGSHKIKSARSTNI